MVWVASITAIGVGIQHQTGLAAERKANRAAKAEERRLGADAALTQEQLLEQGKQDNILRLLAFERDALSESAERSAEQQALRVEGPEVFLANDQSLAISERRRRREAFFSQTSGPDQSI